MLARLSLAKTPVNPMRYPLPKRPSQDSPRSQVIIATKMPNNVTKHFVNGTHSINNNISHNQVIQNYLNQTMPMVTRSAVQRNFTTGSCNKATRSQALKSHLRQKTTSSTITSSTSPATNTTTMKNYRSINSHNQSHGIITASAYKELKNGNVSW